MCLASLQQRYVSYLSHSNNSLYVTFLVVYTIPSCLRRILDNAVYSWPCEKAGLVTLRPSLSRVIVVAHDSSDLPAASTVEKYHLHFRNGGGSSIKVL